MHSYIAAALYEHRFWLQVLGDHARFIKNALSLHEGEEIMRADCFIRSMDQLLEQSRREVAPAQLKEITQAAFQRAQEIRAFKLHLLERQLTGKIGFLLTPTFVNHMVNEVEEYLRILAFLQAGEPVPVFDEIHHHLVWLADATGHAAAITGNLDMTEKRLMDMSRTFEQHFQDYYLKAVELAGYMRTNLSKFPALSRFNEEVELEMALFKQFLRELESLALTKEVLAVLSPLMADHMAREECYYLTKLAQVSEIKPPNCDPTKPRTDG
ncbi:DUF2935 domain-containing protein [Paenibacillus xerothermodurans]|uniref:DUF2935 domain-containing protein n=1 Tax=Paenibacillus xerothermodurans TaxID=1977292 RepID=A0A2W1NQ07_PAEXE|nr:DUF2935 domain-containing protein [Paenibacillus xerothermodurans]PZE20993.1 DUF2935 domain-containing protein [Paenibacillus xerothermodurans]